MTLFEGKKRKTNKKLGKEKNDPVIERNTHAPIHLTYTHTHIHTDILLPKNQKFWFCIFFFSCEVFWEGGGEGEAKVGGT